MATKVVKRKMTNKELKGLTKTQDNIIRLRKELNEQESNAVKPFTIYKSITYICIILFPPYGMYRLWCNKTTFNRTEQFVQTSVCVLYVYVVLATFLG